jgi:DNA-binding NarL/FixJ family response regulator
MSSTRVLVADARFMVSDALGAALADYDELVVLDDRPTTGLEALKAANAHGPDVALLDYWLPDMEGPAAISSLLEWAPQTRVLSLAWFHGSDHIKAALRAGAVGFLPKSVSVAKVAEGIRRAHQGDDPVFGEKVADAVQALRERAQAPDNTGQRFTDLTAREMQILQLLAAGLPGDGIANRLGISTATARTHVEHMMRKMDTSSRLEAVAMAREVGILL